MAKKSSAAHQPANVNTTELEVPQTMHIEGTPDSSDEVSIFKDSIRDEIFAKRRKLLEEEISAQSGLETVEPIEEKPAEEEEPSSPAESPPSPAEEEEHPVEAPAAGSPIPEKVKIKVEGKDLEVPFDTLVSLAQKGMSADERYRQAATQREEAQRLMFAMQNNQNTQPQVAQTNVRQDSLSTIVPDIAKRINYGSEEEQKQALLDYGAAIKAGLRDETNSLPPEQLINVATQRAIETIRLEQEQDTLKKEFPDILADYPLAMATDTIANQLAYKYQQEGKVVSRLELFREAGKAARDRYLPKQEALGHPTQISSPVQAASPQVSDMNTRIERKRAAPKPPVAANKVSDAPMQQYGQSPASIVNQMRKSRGQPVLT